MATTILIIEPSESNRELIKGFLDKLYPASEVELYDPVLLGKPSPAFAWSDYDLVIMDTRLDGQNGLDWLQEFGSDDDFPPVLFLSSDNKVDTAVQAMKLGARDYLLKKGLHYPRLKQAIDEILPIAVSQNDKDEDFDGAQTQVLPEGQEDIQVSQQRGEDSGGYTHYDTQVLPASVDLNPQTEGSEQDEDDTAGSDKTEDLQAIDHLPDVKPISEENDEGQADGLSHAATQVLPAADMPDPYMDQDTVPTTNQDTDEDTKDMDLDAHLGDTRVLPQAKLTSLEANFQAENNNNASKAKDKQEYWDEDTEILFIDPDKDG